MTKRNLWIAAGGAAVALFLLAYGLSPFLAADGLATALQNRDRDQLEQFIDFPSVRENLKADLKAMVIAKMRADPELQSNPFAGLGLVMVPAMVDQMVDAMVTPAAMSRLAEKGASGLPTPGDDPPPADTSAHQPRLSMAYKGLDRFYVTATADDGSKVSFVMARQGLFTWKVKRVELPADLFNHDQKAKKLATAAAEPSPSESDQMAADAASLQGTTTRDDAQAAAGLPPIGQCFATTVDSTGSRLEGAPDSGSSVNYADGHYQVAYEVSPTVQAFRAGDPVRLCVVELPKNCPAGDNRGVVYRAENQRTGGVWTAADSEHECGGA